MVIWICSDWVFSSVMSSHFCFSAGDFIYKVSSQSPTRHFIIHSRKALLNGISPRENRSIPPLKYNFFEFLSIVIVTYYVASVSYPIAMLISTLSRYEFFYALLRDFPDLRFTINGGINTIDEVISSLTCLVNMFTKHLYYYFSLNQCPGLHSISSESYGLFFFLLNCLL